MPDNTLKATTDAIAEEDNAIGGQLITAKTTSANDNDRRRPIVCRSRLGGLLNY